MSKTSKKTKHSTAAPVSNEAKPPESLISALEVPMILKGTDLAIKGGEKLVEWIKSEGPLFVQTLDSYYYRPNGYVLILRITNTTIHGIYLESLKLISPAVRDLVLSAKQTAHQSAEFYSSSWRGLRSRPENHTPQTCRVGPGESLTFKTEFELPPLEELRAKWSRKKKRLAVATLEFSVLNEGLPRTMNIEFCVRIRNRSGGDFFSTTA
jgi:hypothetical protein